MNEFEEFDDFDSEIDDFDSNFGDIPLEQSTNFSPMIAIFIAIIIGAIVFVVLQPSKDVQSSDQVSDQTEDGESVAARWKSCVTKGSCEWHGSSDDISKSDENTCIDENAVKCDEVYHDAKEGNADLYIEDLVPGEFGVRQLYSVDLSLVNTDCNACGGSAHQNKNVYVKDGDKFIFIDNSDVCNDDFEMITSGPDVNRIMIVKDDNGDAIKPRLCERTKDANRVDQKPLPLYVKLFIFAIILSIVGFVSIQLVKRNK